jgi:leucyl-tRNA synthetase
MFLGPFQEGGDFRDTTIIGVRRFLDKLWTAAQEAVAADSASRLSAEVERKLHQTIKRVTTDTERLDYNTAISAMMEYLNTVRDEPVVPRQSLEPLVVMLAPYAPHLAEELWSLFGHERSVFTAPWPAFDERLAAAGDVEVVVQVNGKVRGRVTVSRGASEAEVVARAMQDEAVRKFVNGKSLRKTIYVQDRLVNFVV